MDELDRKIIKLLAKNARMTVKEIAKSVCLTSPAVSQRITRLEQSGVIAGYTIVPSNKYDEMAISAIINISVQSKDKEEFFALVEGNESVRRCHHVTGNYSYILNIKCACMQDIENLINKFRQLGQTNTQIILSTPLDRFGVPNFIDEIDGQVDLKEV